MWAIALNGWSGAAQQIADVFWIANNIVNSGDDSLKCNINSIKMQDLKDDARDDNSVKDNENKFQFGASIEAQSCLYDNFTFEKYSNNPWMHFLGSVKLPISNKSSVSLSESIYYTPEKNNPISENNVTDLVFSYVSSDKFSMDIWLQLSQYLKQKDSDMFSVFLMLNYAPNEKFSISTVPYKPLLLDWKKNSDFYILNTVTYNVLSDKKLLLRTITSCTDNRKTLVWFWFLSSVGDNLSVEFTTIPDDKTWIIPWWLQWSLKYEF